MRISDVILVLGPLVLLAFALGVIDAGLIRLLVILVVVAVGVWLGTKMLPESRPRSGKKRKGNRDEPKE